MLAYKTIESRPLMRKPQKNGSKDVVYIDLLSKVWDDWGEVEFMSPVYVNQYYVARPDLIALAVYGNDAYGDLICKFNGISNPFELNEGMLISVPPLDWIETKTKNMEYSGCELIKPDETIEKRDKIKKLRTDIRSSSTMTVGDKPAFVIDKSLGLVFY